MRLLNFEQRDLEDRHRFDAIAVAEDGSPLPFWYEIAPKIEGLTLDRADAFVLPALVLAMLRGEGLTIEAPVSERLAIGLNDVARIVCAHAARFTLPEISAPQTIGGGASPTPDGAVAGLSGGVDSMYLVYRHHLARRPQDAALSRVFYSDFSLRMTPGARGRVAKLAARRRLIAEELGLPFHTVSSNQSERLGSHNIDHHILRSAAIGHLSASISGQFLFGSSFAFPDIALGQTEDCSYSEPFLLPLLSGDGFVCRSSGSRLRRVEKIAALAGLDIVQRRLRVCWEERADDIGGKANCGRCPKCLRTLLCIEILGKLDAFAQSFDIEAYLACRDGFVLDVARDPADPFKVELLAFGEECGYDLHVARLRRRYWSRPIAYARLLPEPAKASAKRLLGRN